ncbi:MAG: peptide deformylase [Gammaproteobacteria bacterium]|nr:peptide deformylase [Gammaproteobacteria bacterium]
MARLKILTFPDPRLRKIAAPVVKFDKSLVNITNDMFETMYEEGGIGLAATQVDIHERIVVMDLSEQRNDPRVFINPEFKILDDKSLFSCEEGCLSIPGVKEEITRPDKIKAKWQDIEGKHIEDEPQGLLAVCFQHEIDHLEGKLLVDYLSPLKRDRIRKKALKSAR